MSFIYTDKNLLNELLKHGQGAAYTQQTDNFANMRKLLDNLERQITPKPPGGEPEVSHEGDPGTHAELRSENLKSLSALANFLLTNKITIGGKRIVYSEGENPNNEDYVLYRFQPDGTIIETTDRNKTFGNAANSFVINKDLLSAYLLSLQSGLQKRPNKIEEIQLTQLIRQSNNLLDTKINEQGHLAPEQQKPGQPASLSVPAQPAAPNREQLLLEIGQILPFSSEYINPEDIKMFVDKYNQLANNNASVSNLAKQIDDSIAIANRLMSAPGAPVQMSNLTVDQFKMQTTQPEQLARVLWSIVSNAGRLYQQFLLQYQQIISDHLQLGGPGAVRAMQQQIAGGGPQSTNLADLTQLIKEIKEDWQKGFKR